MEECWVGSGSRDQDQLQTQFKSQSQLQNQTQFQGQSQHQLFNLSINASSSTSHVWTPTSLDTTNAKTTDDAFTIFDDSWECVNQPAILSDEKVKEKCVEESSQASRLDSALSVQSAPLGALTAQALNKTQQQSATNQQRPLNQPLQPTRLKPKKSYGSLTDSPSSPTASSLNSLSSTKWPTQTLVSSNGPRRRVTRSLSRHHYEPPPLNVNSLETNSDDDDDENYNSNNYNNDNYDNNSSETRQNHTQNSDDDIDNCKISSGNRSNQPQSLLNRQRSHYLRRQLSSEIQSSGNGTANNSGRGQRRGSGARGNGRRARSPGRRCTPRHFEIQPVKSALKSSNISNANSNGNINQMVSSTEHNQQQLQQDQEIISTQRSMSTTKRLIHRSRSSSTLATLSDNQMPALPLVLPIGFYSKQEMVSRELVNGLIQKQTKKAQPQRQLDEENPQDKESQQLQSSEQKRTGKRALEKRAASLKLPQTPLSSSYSFDSLREYTEAPASRVRVVALTAKKKKKGVMWAKTLEW